VRRLFGGEPEHGKEPPHGVGLGDRAQDRLAHHSAGRHRPHTIDVNWIKGWLHPPAARGVGAWWPARAGAFIEIDLHLLALRGPTPPSDGTRSVSTNT
jgi:hypothetical protein